MRRQFSRKKIPSCPLESTLTQSAQAEPVLSILTPVRPQLLATIEVWGAFRSPENGASGAELKKYPLTLRICLSRFEARKIIKNGFSQPALIVHSTSATCAALFPSISQCQVLE